MSFNPRLGPVLRTAGSGGYGPDVGALCPREAPRNPANQAPCQFYWHVISG